MEHDSGERRRHLIVRDTLTAREQRVRWDGMSQKRRNELMPIISLKRTSLGPLMTTGIISCPNEAGTFLDFVSLELPWHGNARDISCIPIGTFRVVYAMSAHWHMLMPHVVGVPDRDGIEFHIGNTVEDTDGCILVGTRATATGIAASGPAFARFNAWLGIASRRGEVFVKITDPPIT